MTEMMKASRGQGMGGVSPPQQLWVMGAVGAPPVGPSCQMYFDAF